MTTQQIPLNRLVPSPLNVRKTESKAATEELKASILAHGLLQNLVVTNARNGTFEVIAGGRRLHVLNQLVDEVKLEPTHAVPCQVVTAEQAQEMSLAENTVRVAMHPADEFEAFTALADQGSTPAQIAERFGATEKHVLQRLKLGRVAPELLAEYRAGEITLETLMAFTVTDDRKRQTDLYKGLQGWQRDNAHHIRRALTERMTKSGNKLARFVGLDAYEAAGGPTRVDLFDEDIYLEDTALLQRLAGEKLEAAAEELRQDGWGWVEMNFDGDFGFTSRCGRIHPQPFDAPAKILSELKTAEAEQTRITGLLVSEYAGDPNIEVVEKLETDLEAAKESVERIQAKLEAFLDYLPEEKKLAGCYVSIDYSGKLVIEKALVKREDKKAVAQSRPEGAEADETPDDKPGLSQSLVDDLKRYRTQVAQVAIAEHPAIAFDLLVFRVAASTLAHGHSFDGPEVKFSDQYLKPSVAPDTVAAERLEAIKADLPLDWMKAKTEPAQFEAFRQLADADKHRILAYCTALTLRPKLAPAEGKQKSAYDVALALTGARVADYWRPTASNFLSRIKREQLLDIGREVLNPKWAELRKDAKKASLVAELDDAFARSGNSDVLESITIWLPEGMAIAEAEREPAPAKTKKAKNAA